MMKHVFVSMVGIGAVLFPGVALGESFSNACPNLEKCIRHVSRLTGEKYLFGPVAGKINSSRNVQITKENAVLLLTKALHMNGYSRVPLEAPNTYQALKLKEARDTLLPELKGSKNDRPNFPRNWDFHLFTYEAKHPEVVDEMARTARAFMAANTRVIPDRLSGRLFITAAVPDLKNAYLIIRELDVRPSKALLKRWEQQRKRRMQK